MKISRIAQLGAVAAVAALTLTACAANETAPAGGDSSDAPAESTLSGELVGSGASSQEVAVQAWSAGFQGANPDVTVSYDPSGSGAGRDSFQAGAVAFAGSDRAFTADEIAEGPFDGCVEGSGIIELPSYISPIAVIFNVEGVTDLNLDADTLAKIFTGAITTWNDPAIVALNADADLPSTAITAVHRSDDSGTTKNFADYLFQAAPDVWTEKPADPFPYAVGEAAQGTSGVVDAVTNGTNTIGYADASKAGDLGTAAIQVGTEFVSYSAEAAAAVVDESPAGDTNNGTTDLAIKINRTTTDPSHYPLVLVSYIVTCTEYVDAEVAPLVKGYITYITSQDGQAEAAASAGSAPLSAALSDKVATALEAIK